MVNVTGYVAVPPDTATADPTDVPSVVNCTVPVAEEGETVAVTVSALFLAGVAVVGVRVNVVFDFVGIGVPLLLLLPPHPIANETPAKTINTANTFQRIRRRRTINKHK